MNATNTTMDKEDGKQAAQVHELFRMTQDALRDWRVLAPGAPVPTSRDDMLKRGLEIYDRRVDQLVPQGSAGLETLVQITRAVDRLGIKKSLVQYTVPEDVETADRLGINQPRYTRLTGIRKVPREASNDDPQE